MGSMMLKHSIHSHFGSCTDKCLEGCAPLLGENSSWANLPGENS